MFADLTYASRSETPDVGCFPERGAAAPQAAPQSFSFLVLVIVLSEIRGERMRTITRNENERAMREPSIQVMT
jgi:hypothetical protein